MKTISQHPGAVRQDEIIRKILGITISHPAFVGGYRAIRKIHEESAMYGRTRSLLLLGDPGTGKTFTARAYCRAHPDVETPDGLCKPVVFTTLSGKTTPKGVATDLLAGLGDPSPARGSLAAQTERIRGLVNACHTELIFIDEVNHFLDHTTGRVLLESTNWLKSLQNKTGVSMVFLGLPNAKRLRLADDQQKRRFVRDVEYRVFKWSNAKSRKHFRVLLQLIQDKLPVKPDVQLSDPEVAVRMFIASAGSIARVMDLIYRANIVAVTAGKECFGIAELAEAFQFEITDDDVQGGNPFLSSAEADRLLKVSEPPPAHLAKALPFKPKKNEEVRDAIGVQ